MAHLLGYDPCSHFSRAFSHCPSVSSSEVNRNVGFTLKACFDANGRDNANRLFVKEKKKAYGFANLPLPPLLGDLEKGSSVRDDGRDASHIEDRSLGGIPTKPFCLSDQQLPQKLVVAVDVDEVLGNFVSALNEFIADRYSSNHSVSEYHVYEFFKVCKLGVLEFAVNVLLFSGFCLHCGAVCSVLLGVTLIWNCNRDEANTRVHEFFESPYFKSGIQPIPGAQTALQNLSRFCNLSIVTSRQNAIKDHTIEWIEKHFSGLFQEIHFGNHFALDGVSRPKSEICRSLNAEVLIDDNPRYAIECAEAGIRVLLFDYENSYPWSKTESADQHPLVNRVMNWEEVEQQLMSLITLSY